jgi:NADH:ubiquinone oxidoreductase subunit E
MEEIEKKVSIIIDAYEAKRDSLISVLQDIQTEYRYLPEEALRIVAEKMKLPLIQVYGVATFFRAFSLEPKGKHVLSICTGTACHVRGASAVLDEVEREICIAPGETTDDMQFSLETVNCLGACALGPILVVDGKYHGQMVPAKVNAALKRYKKRGTGKDEEA